MTAKSKVTQTTLPASIEVMRINGVQVFTDLNDRSQDRVTLECILRENSRATERIGLSFTQSAVLQLEDALAVNQPWFSAKAVEEDAEDE